MREGDLQKQIIKELKKRNVKVIKIILATRSGEADLVCCYKGKFLQLEVKLPTNKKREPLQTYKLLETREHKGYAFYITAKTQVDTVINHIDCKSKSKKLPLEAKDLKRKER